MDCGKTHKVTSSPESTYRLGKKFTERLKGDENLMLCGELGAGKTTFIQGLGKGLNIRERIISPTYQLIKTYPEENSVLTHVDLYRIEGPKEAWGLDWPEILSSETVTVVEWANRVEALWPEGSLVIKIDVISKLERKISIFERQ